jgi:hypothetical protein
MLNKIFAKWNFWVGQIWIGKVKIVFPNLDFFANPNSWVAKGLVYYSDLDSLSGKQKV